MKRIIPLILTILFPAAAVAGPYFRLINPAHPEPVFGALIDPFAPGKSAAASLLPLVTHSPADGCLLPWFVCEDWTPIAVGASLNAGKFTFDAGPLANILPWMSAGALALTPASWTQARAFLAAPVVQAHITFSAGPIWEYQERTNKGYFKVFTGLALHF